MQTQEKHKQKKKRRRQDEKERWERISAEKGASEIEKEDKMTKVRRKNPSHNDPWSKYP